MSAAALGGRCYLPAQLLDVTQPAKVSLACELSLARTASWPVAVPAGLAPAAEVGVRSPGADVSWQELEPIVTPLGVRQSPSATLVYHPLHTHLVSKAPEMAGGAIEIHPAEEWQELGKLLVLRRATDDRVDHRVPRWVDPV